jgi:hypothetical protein
VAQVVKRLPSKCEALNSNLGAKKKKEMLKSNFSAVTEMSIL